MALTWIAPAAAQKLLPPDPAASIGRIIPFDGFVDQEGRDFRSLLRATGDASSPRPWIVSPMYTRCHYTCGPITAALHSALDRSGLSPADYHVLSFSFDPDETAEGLRAFRARLQLPEEWLTLRAPNHATLDRTLQALDFRTISIAPGAFDHPNLIAILTPDQRLAQYLFGVAFTPSEIAGAVSRARTGVPVLAGREGYLFAAAAIGLLVSALLFFSLLAKRRAGS